MPSLARTVGSFADHRVCSATQQLASIPWCPKSGVRQRMNEPVAESIASPGLEAALHSRSCHRPFRVRFAGTHRRVSYLCGRSALAAVILGSDAPDQCLLRDRDQHALA